MTSSIPLPTLADVVLMSIYKPILFVLVVSGWAWVAGWLDKDLEHYFLPRRSWNAVQMSVAVVAFGLWLLIVYFWVGLIVALVLLISAFFGYAVYRNAQVPEPARWTFTLESLRRRLEPHFLFNALNTLRATIRHDPHKARELVSDLSDLYRYLLNHPEDAPVHSEVEHALAHCNGTAGTRNAVEAGVHTIEHCGWMGPGGRLEIDEDVIRAMLEKGTTVVPTMAVWYRPGYDDFSKMSEDRRMMRAVREERTASWKAMHDSGIRFATGTDTWDPLAREIELMVKEMGISPMEAIVAATRNGAEGLGLDSLIGTIEPEKEADLLLVDGDPLSDLGALRRVNRVYRSGKLVVDRGYLVSDEEAVDRSANIPKQGGRISYDQAFRPRR